ncbi:MAG: hypothetical protein M0O93_05265 [Bacteroidales bacterium]|nr:hypothetical protein [Bacteroidales bacterium]
MDIVLYGYIEKQKLKTNYMDSDIIIKNLKEAISYIKELDELRGCLNNISSTLKQEMKIENVNKQYHDLSNHCKIGRAFVFTKPKDDVPF